MLVSPWSENAEILTTHSSTAPSGSTVTLASNTVNTHYAGEKVYRIEFNQVEISNATTLTGSKSVVATSALSADKQVLAYLDTANSSGYYFGRFKNSVAGTFGSYSDGIAYGSWTRNAVGYIIDRALRDLKLSFSELIDLFDCYEWINEGLEYIQGKLKRWPEHYSYNAVLGQVQRGTNVQAMPTDAYDLETNKSIIGLRIGTDKNLEYLDPKTFDNQLTNVAVTQVTTQATSGQTTLAINNSYDFADSGTVSVYISGTKYSITYTGVTRSTTSGVLTGVPASGAGSITVTIAVNTYVWQNETEGTPIWFTVRNSNIEFWPLADANHDNANMFSDYAKVATKVDSDGDTIDFQRYGMVQSFLTWRMKMKVRNNGDLDMNDGYFMQFKEKLNDAIRTLPQNNVFPTRPNINRMYKRLPLRKADIQDLQIGEQ